MRNRLPCIVALALIASMGCGGGSSSPLGNTVGPAGTVYSAPLPDGSSMLLMVSGVENGVWSGEFTDTGLSGPLGEEGGFFRGTMSGNSFQANCESDTGEAFTLSGTATHGGGLKLTRSDLPGTTLVFTSTPPRSASRAEVRFTLQTGSGSSGTAVFNSTPVVQNSSCSIYSGTWRGYTLSITVYTNGLTRLTIDGVYGGGVQLHFKDLPFSDFGIKTVAPYESVTITAATSKTSGYVLISPIGPKISP